MVKSFQVSDHHIGDAHPCFIIAEAGVNHDGDPEIARLLVVAAQESGADAIKFQTFTAGELTVPTAPKAGYQMVATDTKESQRDMLQKLQLSDDDYRGLSRYSKKRGIAFLSSPFGEREADLLNEIDVPAFKIPSGEITNIDLLSHIARFQKPIILSTGMANLEEVGTAVSVMRREGNSDIALLHCVSNYPADPIDANLRAMATMSKAFNLPIGFSDHTLGNEVAFAAVALGACIIERHLTLDPKKSGPDHAASLSPKEFKKMAVGIRVIESALGHGRKEPVTKENAIAAIARRSLVAATDIPMGSRITVSMITAKRPGTGISPAEKDTLVGRTAKSDITKDTLFTLETLT